MKDNAFLELFDGDGVLCVGCTGTGYQVSGVNGYQSIRQGGEKKKDWIFIHSFVNHRRHRHPQSGRCLSNNNGPIRNTQATADIKRGVPNNFFLLNPLNPHRS